MLGAAWYLLSIERETTCWTRACGDQSACRKASFYCDDDHTGFVQFLNQSCPIQTPNSTIFDFGIFLDALQSGVVESKDFPQKFFYCFWWGLQNLRYFSSGSNVHLPNCVFLVCISSYIVRRKFLKCLIMAAFICSLVMSWGL